MLRTEEARNRRSQARTVYKHLKGTHDKGRIAEEPGEGKLSSPVLEQRWAGRLTHRLSQIERHEFGLDVIAWVGTLRYAQHRSLPEIHQHLRSRGVAVAPRTVAR